MDALQDAPNSSPRPASTGLPHPSKVRPFWDEFIIKCPKADDLPQIPGWEERISLPPKTSRLHVSFTLSLPSPHFFPTKPTGSNASP